MNWLHKSKTYWRRRPKKFKKRKAVSSKRKQQRNKTPRRKNKNQKLNIKQVFWNNITKWTFSTMRICTHHLTSDSTSMTSTLTSTQLTSITTSAGSLSNVSQGIGLPFWRLINQLLTWSKKTKKRAILLQKSPLQAFLLKKAINLSPSWLKWLSLILKPI